MVYSIASELQTRNAWPLAVPLSSKPHGHNSGSPVYRRCLSWTKSATYRRFPSRLPVSDLKECPYTVPQGQIGGYGNDRPLSSCNVQTKGTVFSSLVAEVLKQIAKRVTLWIYRPHLWRLVPNDSDLSRREKKRAKLIFIEVN